VDLDAGAGIAATVQPREQLEKVGIEADSVVIGHRAQIVEAADPVEGGGGGRGAIGSPRLGRGMSESRIVAWQEGLEDAGRLL